MQVDLGKGRLQDWVAALRQLPDHCALYEAILLIQPPRRAGYEEHPIRGVTVDADAGEVNLRVETDEGGLQGPVLQLKDLLVRLEALLPSSRDHRLFSAAPWRPVRDDIEYRADGAIVNLWIDDEAKRLGFVESGVPAGEGFLKPERPA